MTRSIPEEKHCHTAHGAARIDRREFVVGSFALLGTTLLPVGCATAGPLVVAALRELATAVAASMVTDWGEEQLSNLLRSHGYGSVKQPGYDCEDVSMRCGLAENGSDGAVALSASGANPLILPGPIVAGLGRYSRWLTKPKERGGLGLRPTANRAVILPRRGVVDPGIAAGRSGRAELWSELCTIDVTYRAEGDREIVRVSAGPFLGGEWRTRRFAISGQQIRDLA